MKRFLCLLFSLVLVIAAIEVEICAVEFDVSAKAAVLIEAQTGHVIYSKNKDICLPMASTTKIMTTLITLESGSIDEEFILDYRRVINVSESGRCSYQT